MRAPSGRVGERRTLPVNEHGHGRPRRASRAHPLDATQGGSRLQIGQSAPYDVLGQGRDGGKVLQRPDAVRRQLVLVEEFSIVRHLPICEFEVPEQPTELELLEASPWRDPLTLLELAEPRQRWLPLQRLLERKEDPVGKGGGNHRWVSGPDVAAAPDRRSSGRSRAIKHLSSPTTSSAIRSQIHAPASVAIAR